VKRPWIWLAIITLGAAWISSTLPAFADDDEYEHGEYGEHREHERGSHSHGIIVSNPLYKSECGSCHLAYQPGFLPASSWKRMMATLDDHFGENAELSAEQATELTKYLTDNASDADSHRPVADAPLRITEQRHFRREHDEVPVRLVKDNPKVRSFANCAACHVGADNGDFSEHRINIPGYGRWDD